MKKIIIFLFFPLALTISVAVHGKDSLPQETAVSQDSTISVIGWFNKNDTVIYRIDESMSEINDTNSTCIAFASMTVRINVVDSTADGYKMEYKFLDFVGDKIPDSAPARTRFLNQITAELSKKIVGSTVLFETDELGHITKINNLEQLKKKAKTLFKIAVKEFSQLPETKLLKKEGINLENFANDVFADKFIDSYLEDLELLFMFHGNVLNTGNFTVHQDATDSKLESSTTGSIYIRDDDGSYHIDYKVTNILPNNKLKALAGQIVESISNDSLTAKFNNNIDTAADIDGTYEEYLQIDYEVNGWPYYVNSEKSTKIGKRGKDKYKEIFLEYGSFYAE